MCVCTVSEACEIHDTADAGYGRAARVADWQARAIKAERQVTAVRKLGARAKASPPNDDWYDGWAEGIAQCVAALDGTA